ncbi:hypothetical protein [Cyanobium sp. Lug-B]|uniref:hypothetical protein n=1 Tax=Cyanobium sp. Lug-B TaxID=2823716 RepID=UPI0020CD49B1|nr:hypothetical protein [Cyanobium sp. Lug-B]MCP9796211.1 hypothetical protein [Cyanobium sp. Lug-B]
MTTAEGGELKGGSRTKGCEESRQGVMGALLICDVKNPVVSRVVMDVMLFFY